MPATDFSTRRATPRAKRIAIHADLGRAEWATTPAVVEAVAAALRLPLLVVRRPAGDLVARWEQRFLKGKARFEALSTYGLIGPWSQANKRFCTSELKAQVMGPALARRFRGETIVSVIGLRRQESVARAATPVAKVDDRFAKPGNPHGTRMLVWHPAVDWPVDEVFACHHRHGLPLHEAYHVWNASRLGCRFCVLADLGNLQASAAAPANLDHFLHLVGMEASSTFSFQPTRWLADVAPHLLPATLRIAIGQAKIDAAERRRLETEMPPALRFVKGWPPRAPTLDEAERIVRARRPILRRHGLADRFPRPEDVVARFDELLVGKRTRSRRDVKRGPLGRSDRGDHATIVRPVDPSSSPGCRTSP